MADFQLLKCAINIGGTGETIVYRDETNPISYPEYLIMCYMHGDDSVDEVQEVGTLTMSNLDLLHHLNMTYPAEAVHQCFPGARPNLPTGSDQFHKSRAVLMKAQRQREAQEAPGPGPNPDNMNVPEPEPKKPPARPPRTHHAAQRHSPAAGGKGEEETAKKDDEDAGPFA